MKQYWELTEQLHSGEFAKGEMRAIIVRSGSTVQAFVNDDDAESLRKELALVYPYCTVEVFAPEDMPQQYENGAVLPGLDFGFTDGFVVIIT